MKGLCNRPQLVGDFENCVNRSYVECKVILVSMRLEEVHGSPTNS